MSLDPNQKLHLGHFAHGPVGRLARLLALLAAIAISVVAARAARSLDFDTSLEVWFLEDDPDLVAYHRFLEIFGSDRLVVLAWEDDELWTEEGLAHLADLSERAAGIDSVLEVRSLTTVRIAEADPGSIRLERLVSEERDPAEARAIATTHPLIRNRLVSADGRVPAVVLTVDPDLDASRDKLRIARELRALAAATSAARDADAVLAGPTIIDDAFVRYTQRDLKVTFPVMFAVIIVVVLVLYRTWRALLLPMTVVSLASLWVAGIMGSLGIRMTVIHSAIFPMLLGMGIANAMHLLSRTVQLRSEGQGPDDAGRHALELLLMPSLLTALTSAAGLLSLLTASLRPLREMGFLAAVGVLGAFLLTYALGPWLLPRLAEAPRGSRGGAAWERWDAGLARLSRAVQGRPWQVLGAAAIVTAVAAAGIPRIEMGINVLDYFKRDSEVRVEAAFVDRHLEGTMEVDVLIEADEEGALLEPEVIAAMVETEAFLRSREGVGAVVSPATWLGELRRVARGGDEAERQPPDSRAEAAQLLLMTEDPTEVEAYLDFDRRRGRVAARIQATKIPALVEGLESLDEVVHELFAPHGVRATATGLTKLVRNMERFLLRSQVSSLGTAFVTVLLLIVVALRSLRLGMLAMVPNMVPIVVVLGLMGWTGIPLDPGTAMTAAVAIGLVVDDTVHFLHHLRERLDAGDDIPTATELTLVRAGRAAAMAAVILTAAFLVQTTASFKPNIYFGLLSGVTVLLAAAAELVLLPACLAAVPERWIRKKSPSQAGLRS